MNDISQMDDIDLAQHLLERRCEHCYAAANAEDQDHDDECPIKISFEEELRQEEEWRKEAMEEEAGVRQWREYENEMWDHERGDWKY